MKKFAAIGLTLFFVFFGLSACKKAGTPKAGSAAAEDMLSLIPKDAQGIVVIDVHRAMTTEFADKAIKENKEYQKYQNFIKETGIDPQKDVYFVALGVSGIGNAEENSGSGVGVINLKYNKDTLLAKLKAQATNVQETTYEGTPIYTLAEGEGKKPNSGAFLDESNIVLGPEKSVKAVIDVAKKKADSVLKNAEMADLIKAANKNALLWSVFSFPAAMMKNMAAKNPMLGSLESVNALSMYFDYKNKSLQFEIKGMGGNADKNKQVADFLTGLKALGGMASAEKPEVGELMNKIEITSAPDSVKIFANIPEDLLNKLSATAQKTVEEKLAGTKTTEEKKVEEKKEGKK